MKESFVLYYNSIKKFLADFNLFATLPPTTDSNVLKSQIISTRLYCFSLLLIVSILAFITSRLSVTIFDTIPTPSYTQYQQLNQRYPLTLTCPCINERINHQHVVNLSVSYHQVCQSDFVQNTWINSFLDKLRIISSANFSNTGYPLAGRYTFQEFGYHLFQALQSFCRLSSDTINDVLQTFYQSQFNAITLWSPHLFQSNINEIIANLISNTRRSFVQAFRNIRESNAANGLISGLLTNFRFQLDTPVNTSYGMTRPISTLAWITVNDSNICSCGIKPSCVLPASISLNVAETVPGIYTGCYIIEALLQSSLICFYNQSCIDRLLFLLNLSQDIRPTSLDSVASTRYSPNTNFSDIIDQLMVENWSNITSHSDYYQQCQPSSCSYSYQIKNQLITVLTTIIEVVGGLTLILSFVIPKLVHLVRAPSQPNTTHEILLIRLHNAYHLLVNTIRRLNLFELYSPDHITEEQKTRLQIIITRIYIILLMMSLFILAIYSSQVPQTQIITITSPSYEDYLSTYDQYSESLFCPCSTNSIRYETFVEVEVEYHHICESVFVSDYYLHLLNDISNEDPLVLLGSGLIHWRLMKSWCQLAKENYIDDAKAFYLQELTTSQVVALKNLNEKVLSAVQLFRTTVLRKFINGLFTHRDTTMINGIWVGYLTNSIIGLIDDSSNNPYIIQLYQSYQNATCNCFVNSSCTDYTLLLDRSVMPPRFFMNASGLLLGCYLVEAVLQTSLQCYYDQSCLDEFHRIIALNITPRIRAINFSHIQTQFPANTPILSLMAAMLIETWSNSSSHASFFHQCRPSSCTYSYVGKNQFIVVITTIIGLIGGLNTILKLAIPRITDFIRQCRHRRHRHIQQHLPVVDQPWKSKIMKLLRDKRRLFLEFNLFSSPSPHIIETADEIRGQRIATRLYLVCLIVPLLILALYTAEVTVINTITVNEPSYQIYIALQEQYSKTLSCPCTSISTRYDQFMSLRVGRYHEVCENSFITENWARIISETVKFYRIRLRDFRLQGTAFFQGMQKLCSATSQTIKDDMIIFHAQHLVTTNLLSPDAFRKQLDFSMNTMITSASKSFMRTLLLVRETTQSNKLLSTFSTNAVIVHNYRSDMTLDILPTYLEINENSSSTCNCFRSAICSRQASILNLGSIAPDLILHEIPGIRIGCFIIESLLASSLQCFYNQSCIDEFRLYLYPSPSFITPSLNASFLHSSTPSSTISEIVNRLMVEQWINETSHQSYFDQCHPTECKYSLTGKNSWLIVLTKVIGMISGLSAVLKVVIPYTVKIIRSKIIGRIRRRPRQIDVLAL